MKERSWRVIIYVSIIENVEDSLINSLDAPLEQVYSTLKSMWLAGEGWELEAHILYTNI